MGILSLIANLVKALGYISPIFSFLRENKLVTVFIATCSIVITISCYYIAKSYYDNMSYRRLEQYDNYVKYVDEILTSCGDRTAISVSIINTRKMSIEQDFWLGRFEIARACDKSFGERCIINLKDRLPSLYSVDHKIGISSYKFFLRLGKNILPAHFHFRDKNDEQTLGPVEFYPTIKHIIGRFDWTKHDLLEDLWITSILSDDSTVLYVITFLSAKPQKEATCFNNDSIVIGLRDFIIKNR